MLKMYMERHDISALVAHIEANSNLPGARANLSLVSDAMSVLAQKDINEVDISMMEALFHYKAEENTPSVLVAMVGLGGLGVCYAHCPHEHDRLRPFLIAGMNDDRWRMREIITESLKFIAEINYSDLISFFNKITDPTAKEVRAMVATLGHPSILKTREQQDYALKQCQKGFDYILENESSLSKDDRDILKKGLSFAPSVIIAADSENGFSLLEQYIGKAKLMDQVILANLGKNRLVKGNEDRIETLKAKIKG